MFNYHKADMTIKSLALTVVAGIATFLVVGIAVTALAEPWIEFSVFLGLPAGLVAGAAAAAVVSLGLADDAPAQRRQRATGFALFGAGFLVTLVALVITDTGLTLAMAVGLIVGLIVGIVGYLRAKREPPIPQA